MDKQKKFTVLICDDSEAERRRFYDRQYENFNIYGVIRRNGKFIETDPVDSVQKLHKTLLEQRARNELPDIVLLDLFYKRKLPNVDELEKRFVTDIRKFKTRFESLRKEVNEYLDPSGVELLRGIRLTDGISAEELPICIYTDKNFNFLLSKDFNLIYDLAPNSINKDRDINEPHSEIPAATEYFRILRIIESEKTPKELATPGRDVFITHGRSEDWLKVQVYLEKQLNVRTVELAQEKNLGRTVIQKLDDVSGQCGYAIVVMTGDDADATGVARVRENVMHEIGFFQGRLGLNNICLLHEKGTSIPSNLSGLVYLPYESGKIESVYPDLAKELESLTRN